MREDFLSMAGHELRTPLAAIALQLHTLRRRIEKGDTDEAIHGLTKIAAQFERLNQLTEELLDVTRITSGRLVLERQETDLSELVKEVADRHRDAALRHGSELRIQAPEAVTGQWDRSRLDQVATNLLSNAVKFGRGKPIEIRVEPGRDRACLTVEDAGIGISAEDQEKIFERFERAVSQRDYGGIGLGLWISRQIVDAHGSRIQVVSKVGHGSTFRVELPNDAPGENA